MANRLRVVCAAALLLFGGVARPSVAQTAMGDEFLERSLRETDSIDYPTLAQWAERHPGEQVTANTLPQDEADTESARDLRNRTLEGRWCLRSTAAMKFSDGTRVRRIALFYPPRVDWQYKPLPPLPTESGAALREHGCRLGAILFELEPVGDAREFADRLTKRLPGQSEPAADADGASSGQQDWKPMSTVLSGDRSYRVYLRGGQAEPTSTARQAAVLLQMQHLIEYGPPSRKTIEPRAGEPWLAPSAARVADMPLRPTLDMLSFLAPRVGEYGERPLLDCKRQLIPVLRNWFAMAERLPAEQHAAALILADAVAGHADECAEFATETPSGQATKALEDSLHAMGIETEIPRAGAEMYAGGLLKKAEAFAHTRAADELYWAAVLNAGCEWSAVRNTDCTEYIRQGDKFLTRYPDGAWSPSVHLLLAQAYSGTVADDLDDDSPDPAKDEAMLKKAAGHYRAWFASSTSERDRPLVWQEIWALDAGLRPWLLAPKE